LATSGKSCLAGPIRILVVDDCAPFREVLHQLLDSFLGLTVIDEAEDGHSAIEMASCLNPQVITMDIQMPRLGGVEATRRIKNTLPGVRVIGVSSQDDRVTREAMETAGASAFIGKDCAHTLPQLIAKIADSH